MPRAFVRGTTGLREAGPRETLDPGIGMSNQFQNLGGSTISAGMAVAIHESGFGVTKALADGEILQVAIGLIKTTTLAGQDGNVQFIGLFQLADWTAVIGGASLTVNATYFLDPNTPGTLTATVPNTLGDFVQIVGVAVTTKMMRLMIESPVLL